MSAIARPMPRAAPRTSAVAFAEELLLEQGVSRTAAGAASRALALLLERTPDEREPVFLSAEDGAALCDFEPRTWWLVKRRLVASATSWRPPGARLLAVVPGDEDARRATWSHRQRSNGS